MTDFTMFKVLALQERLQAVTEKEAEFKKLADDASIDKGITKQLYESWLALHNAMTTLIERRMDGFQHCSVYHKQLTELTTQLDAAAIAVDDVQMSEDASASHRLARMQVA